MRVGIDPGITGGIAFLNDNKSFIGVLDMPVMALGKGKKQQVNPAELSHLLLENIGSTEVMFFIEEVAAMPHQGVVSMFNFGTGYGMVQGVIAAIGWPYRLIKPKLWKSRAGLIGAEKDAARTLAQQLYPLASLGKKKDIGRADALLIARYGD